MTPSSADNSEIEIDISMPQVLPKKKFHNGGNTTKISLYALDLRKHWWPRFCENQNKNKCAMPSDTARNSDSLSLKIFFGLQFIFHYVSIWFENGICPSHHVHFYHPLWCFWEVFSLHTCSHYFKPESTRL